MVGDRGGWWRLRTRWTASVCRVAVLMLLSALVGACTEEGGGLPRGTPLPSRSGEIAHPGETSEPEPSPKEGLPTEASPTEEPSPTTAETTVPPASETPTPGAEGNKNKDKEG